MIIGSQYLRLFEKKEKGLHNVSYKTAVKMQFEVDKLIASGSVLLLSCADWVIAVKLSTEKDFYAFKALLDAGRSRSGKQAITTDQ